MATALITGASSGIGEQFAYALAAKKYDLVLVARREDRLKSVGASAMRLGAAKVETIVTDLTQPESPAIISRTLETAGTEIEYLVNNAGFGTAGRFDRLPIERELEEIRLNVEALVALTRALLPAMVARRRGTIINVASTAAFQAVPYMATYAATKAFVLSFSEAIAGEIAGSGVTLMAFCPGPVKTEFQSVAKNQHGRVPAFAYQDAATVVSGAIAAAEGGRTVYIPGMLNFTTAQITRVVPRGVVNFFARRIYKPVADNQGRGDN